MDEIKMVAVCWNGLKFAVRNQKGQGMVEYGLILALVAVVAIAALGGLGNKLSPMFNNVASSIK